MRYELFGFNSRELGEKFELERILNNGYLPRIYFSDNPDKMLDAYVSQYLKEEIAAEGLVRKLPAYSRFLQMAALSDCAVECKGANKINSGHLKGLRYFADEYPDVGRKIIVCLDEKNRKTDDGIEMIHFTDFIEQLWKGEIF